MPPACPPILRERDSLEQPKLREDPQDGEDEPSEEPQPTVIDRSRDGAKSEISPIDNAEDEHDPSHDPRRPGDPSTHDNHQEGKEEDDGYQYKRYRTEYRGDGDDEAGINIQRPHESRTNLRTDVARAKQDTDIPVQV